MSIKKYIALAVLIFVLGWIGTLIFNSGNAWLGISFFVVCVAITIWFVNKIYTTKTRNSDNKDINEENGYFYKSI